MDRRSPARPLVLLIAGGVLAACAVDPAVVSTRADLDTVNPSTTTSPDQGSGADDDPETVPAATDPAPEEPLAALLWQPCDDQLLPELTMECATLAVPRDYDELDGEQLSIAVARYDTAAEDVQIGSLIVNPGGPGGSGVDFLPQMAVLMSDDIQQAFDLVSFDPRGVGASTAVDCDLEFDDEITLLAAGDDEGWAELVDEAEHPEQFCSPTALELAEYVGTNNAARDLDLLRAALGDDGLTYLGYSYGTRLGATYAEMFPDRIRAMVLDGAVKPSTDLDALDAEQAAGFDRAYDNFVAACDGDADCVLNTLGGAAAALDDARARVAQAGSIPTEDDGRVLTAGELDLSILSALYSTSAWPYLADGIEDVVRDGDGSVLQALADSYLGRGLDGTYDNSHEANTAVSCADDAQRPTAAEQRAAAEAAADSSTHFAALQRAATGCLGWPAARDPLLIGPAVGAPPLLVVGSTGDPATPIEWAEELANFLDSGVLLRIDAEGHTAYGSVDCATAPIDIYLIDLEVPSSAANCSADDNVDYFPEVSDINVFVGLLDCLRANGLDLPEVTEADMLADSTGETIRDLLDPSDPGLLDASQSCVGELLALSELSE